MVTMPVKLNEVEDIRLVGDAEIDDGTVDATQVGPYDHLRMATVCIVRHKLTKAGTRRKYNK